MFRFRTWKVTSACRSNVNRFRLFMLTTFVLVFGVSEMSIAAPPSWLSELVAARSPETPSDIVAIHLLAEQELVVSADGKMRRRVRRASRILRQEGIELAVIQARQDSWSTIRRMHAWLISASGKHVEMNLRDAVQTSDIGLGEVATDKYVKELRLPAAGIGDVVGYELEIEQSPLQMSDVFAFQGTIPVLEARYSVKLPAGWTMNPIWFNYRGVEAVDIAPQQWRWTLKNVSAVSLEPSMPALEAVVGHLFVSVSPRDGVPQLSTWSGLGGWFEGLAKGQRVTSDAIRSRTRELVAGKTSDLEKMRAIASFVQREVRYVGIQLGIGGFQPHAAAEIFKNRFGDCKDKATLLGVMLREIGIDSQLLLVNTDRSLLRLNTPPSLQFDHVILAVHLPQGLQDPSLLATIESDDGGPLLLFDPTDELTSFGRIRGELQGSVGLLVSMEGSRLITSPQLMPDQSGVRRTARLVLDAQGLLSGEISERITGLEAMMQRGYLRGATRESDSIKMVEARLAQSLSSFQVSGVKLRNRDALEQPLEWDFNISAPSFARRSSDLLMVRPRVLGVFSVDLPGQDKRRVYDLMLSEPRQHSDDMIIELPNGYVVDSLPRPVEIDVGFAIYRSRSEVKGSQLRYMRSYEVRALVVPAANIEDFYRLHREIARDERAVAVLRREGA